MNENQPAPIPPSNPPAPVVPPAQVRPTPPVAADATPPAKKKKRRLWLKIIGGVVVLLILLILLLPTILSLGMVRSIVVGKVNDRLNGKLEIQDWSFGWSSGAHIDGVKIVDADGRQIFQLKSLDAPVSLIGAMRGRYSLHKIVIDGLDVYARREADGSLNFAKLAKASPATPLTPTGERSPSAPAVPETEKKSEPATVAGASSASPGAKLPDVDGEIVLTHCTATIDDVSAGTTAHLTSLEADVKIPGINEPITETLELTVDNGKGATGKISASGFALAVKNNLLMTDPAQLVREADIDQKLTLAGFDLSTIAPFLNPSGGIDKIAGMSNGEVTIRFKPSTDADISAMLRVAGLAVSGSALKHDTFAAQSLDVQAGHITLILPPDAKDVSNLRLRTGPADGTAPTSVTLLQAGDSKSTITAFADVSTASLNQLAARKTPGDTGTIRTAVDLDLAHLVSSMPNLCQLQKGVSLKTGRLTEATVIDLTADKAVVRQNLSVTDLTGHNANTNSDIALKPIDLSISASDLGGGGLVPDIRNPKLSLTSTFANASFQGESVDDLRGELHATLQQMQTELGQIIDFKQQQFAGELDITLNSKGNLLGLPTSSGPPHAAAFDVHGSLKDLKLADAGKTLASEPLTQFALTGSLSGSDAQPVEHLKGLDFTATAGDGQKLTLDSHITAELAFERSGTAAAGPPPTAIVLQQATIQKCNLDLSLAAQQFGGMVPALSNFRMGMVVIGGYAKRNGANTRSIIQTYLQNVDLQRSAASNPDGSAPVAGAATIAPLVLQDYTLHLLADLMLTADSSGSQFNLTKLTADDNQHLLAIDKTDARIQLTTGSGADAKAVGLLDMVRQAEASISVPSLAKLNDVLNALSPTPPITVAGEPKTPPAAPQPKAVITAGSALITLNVTNSNGQLKIVPKVTVSPDLAIAAGNISQTLGPIDLSTEITVVPSEVAVSSDPAAKAPTLLEQIKQLDIPQLSAHAVGAEVSLKEPLHFTDLAGLTTLFSSTGAPPGAASPVLNVALLVKGDLAPLAHLLETLNGAAQGSLYPYSGALQLDEKVGTANGAITLAGQGDITHFAMHSGNTVTFSEDDIHLADDLGLELGTVTSAKIGSLLLEMQSSKALSLAVKGGLIDLAKERKFENFSADLTYDAAPLWKIVLPLLSKDSQAKFKDAAVSGKFSKHFDVTGGYPANVPMNEAIKNLSASGGIALGGFKGNGIDLQNLVIPVFMKNGKAYIANSDKPGDYAAPASLNGGTLSLAGIEADLDDPHCTVSMPPNSQVMKNVALNAALADMLGKDIGNPLFANAGKSSGLMSVLVEKCDQLPTDETMKQKVASNKGVLAMDVSIADLTIAGGNLGGILDKFGPALQLAQPFLGSKATVANGINGSVKNYKISLANGISSHDMTITLGQGKRSMHFVGDVNLATMALKNTVLTLPISLFGYPDEKWPNGINVVLTGTVSSPKLDAGAAVKKSILGNSNPLGNLLGGNKNNGGNNAATQPSGNNDDAQKAIDALQGLLGGNKKK